MNIVMAVSESLPYCKTGGLADVSYSLSKELVKDGHSVSVFLPLYDTYRKKLPADLNRVSRITVPMAWRREIANVYRTESDGISFYLVENRQYFERGHIYGDNDDGERFAFFSLAVLRAMMDLGIVPDILHAHDWQPAMIPCLIREDETFRDHFRDTRTVLTIHNPAFQGMLDKTALGDLYNLPDRLYDDGKVRLYERVSTLKSGILYADKITTVSPTHHVELLTESGGMGLAGALRLREYDFSGILNGIDYQEFSPRTDAFIPARYNRSDALSKKALDRKALFGQLGMKDTEGPLFSIVSRLTSQKGMDLVFAGIDTILSRHGKVVVLGSGEPRYEETLRALRAAHPDDIGIFLGYNNELAHLIYAASDFYLMPSLFEPCGLSQMIAERYGTLPLVRTTGGLRDSVVCYDGKNEEEANGFGFMEYSPEAMIRTCRQALDAHSDRELFAKLTRNAMDTDNSWKKSAKEYMKIYRALTR